MFRIGTGIGVLLFALWFVYLGFRVERVFFIHGAVVGALGVAILLNTREDDIEEINEPKEKE